jgi:hypothetical protein
MRPKVFVSHTDGTDAEARKFRAKLKRGLERRGFEVLLDEQRLELGDAWRRQLYLWLLGSHAGVIIVSQRALEGSSEWMRFEASWLRALRTSSEVAAARTASVPAFPVIPVLIPPVVTGDFGQSWLEPMAFDELQVGTANAALVAEIADRLEPLRSSPADARLGDVQQAIARWLRRVDVDVLREAGETLGAGAGAWLPDRAPELLALELLKADLDGVGAAISILAIEIPERASRLVEILGAGWVDPEAAAMLPPVTVRDTHRVVAINGERHDFTAGTYAQRAWAPVRPVPLVSVPEQGELDLEGIAREMIRAVRRVRTAITSDADAASFLRRAGGGPFLVAIKGAPDRQTVSDLTARFPAVTFIFLTGPDLPSAAERSRSDVEYLFPALQAGREDDSFWKWVEVRGIVDDAIRSTGDR